MSKTGFNLRQARQALDMSQRDLAREVGVSHAVISKWEAGVRIKTKYATKIASVLKIDPKMLLPDEATQFAQTFKSIGNVGVFDVIYAVRSLIEHLGPVIVYNHLILLANNYRLKMPDVTNGGAAPAKLVMPPEEDDGVLWVVTRFIPPPSKHEMKAVTA